MSEFKEVMHQFKRMCDAQGPDYQDCCECAMRNHCTADELMDNPEEVEETIMNWAKEHPVVTNADKFKEVFGFAHRDHCPVYKTELCEATKSCAKCNYDNFWYQEYKEPKGADK